MMKIRFAKLAPDIDGALVVFAAEKSGLTAIGREVDKATRGQIVRAIKAADYKAAAETTLAVLAPDGLKAARIIVAGLGDPAKLNGHDLERIGGTIAAAALSGKEKTAAIALDAVKGLKIDAADAAALIANGARLNSYRFDKYRTKEKDNGKPVLATLEVRCAAPARARRAFQPLNAVTDGVVMARDLVNEPANVLDPVEFARRARSLTKLGLKVQVLADAELKKLKMNALLGVAQGSAKGARVVVMRWNGGKPADKPIAFVGKGVTFDTGGISIKPAGGMEDMKGDMGGAACVTGLMAALAGRKAKVNAVGIIGLVENMPDGKAQRPGDIVTSMSGQTIEVLNTDAEGRLVLADALTYVQAKHKPRVIVDLATLTGAILVALGQEFAGLFCNDDDLAKALAEAGEASGEKVWRMPLAKAFDKMIDSKTADMKNIGGRYAGSSTAAQFLQRFVDDTPWAHLDIAGTAMKSPSGPLNKSWGSGFGVRLLDRLVADGYEG